MDKKEPKISSMKELETMMEVSGKLFEHILEKLKKDFPKLNIGEDYNGYLRPYMDEYVKTFIVDDYKKCKKFQSKTELKEIQAELCHEIMFIECFCRWLDEEKGVKLNG